MKAFSTSLDTDRRLGSVIARLMRETGSTYWKGYALALLLSAVVAATTGAVAFLIEDVIDEIFVEKSYQALIALSVAVLVIFVARGLAMFGQAVLLNQIGNAIVLELQVKLFRKVLSKEPSFLARNSSGELMTVISTGAGSAQVLLQTIATSVGRDLFTLIALLIVLLWQNTTLALGLLIGIPIIAFVISIVAKRLRGLARKHLEISALLTNRIRSTIQGMRVVKAFSMEDQFGASMSHHADELRRVSNKFAIVSNRVAPLMELVGGVAIAGAIAFGGWRVISQGETPGELVSFIFAALMAYDPARRLGAARSTLERSLVGVRMMYDFLDAVEAHEEREPTLPELKIDGGAIEFDNVSFAYEPDNPILRGVSFKAPAGKTTAIVGRSGGGKSTIVNLLLRFWSPDHGSVSIDGQDLADHSVISLRQAIAYVGQDAFLFDGSLRENILVGNRGASEEQLIAAAQAAGADAFIQALPNGYDTLAGELGSNLSGGQKQRIAIARALIRDSAIVVLDEPTSALDVETERTIQGSLRQLAQGRTTIVIAHRLSTIRDADQIVVIDHGRVVETGTHDGLISAGGAYARLYGEIAEQSDAPVDVTSEP